MAYRETTGYCSYCQRQVLIRRRSPNHILHLLLSVFTCVWLPVWILLAVRIGGWRCAYCGQSVGMSGGFVTALFRMLLIPVAILLAVVLVAFLAAVLGG
jgi:hypothetical protein